MESTHSYDNNNIALTSSAYLSKRSSRLRSEIYTAPLLLGIAFASIVGIAGAHAQDAGGQDAGALALPEVNVEGANAAGAAVESLPMLVQVPKVALTGTKVEDLPLSIKVVPSELISEQGGTHLADVVQDVSGLSTGGADSHGFFDRFLIRGLDARIYTDGFTDGDQLNGIPHSLNGVQSVEVLKGPGSALLGSGPPGGTINITHFAPASTLAYGAGVQYGSYNTLSSNYWATGPTSISGLDFRIDGLVQHSSGFRSLKSGDYEVRPVLRWDINDHVITFVVDARRLENTPDPYGLLYFHGAPISIARNTKYSTPFNFAQQNLVRVELSDVWTVNDFLTINNRFSYLHRASQILRNGDSGTIVGVADTGRSLRLQYDASDDFDYTLEPVWRFHTASVGHTLVTGFEAQHESLFTNQSDANLPNIENIFAPIIPETSTGNLNFIRTATKGEIDSLKATYLGAYATDQIDVTDQLKLRLSGRQNWWSTTLTPDIFIPGRIFEGSQVFLPGVNYGRADSPFDWSAGILYKVLPGVSPYFGVARSHLANFTSEATTAAIQAPESALQYELGVKLNTPDNRLNFTLAAFNVDRQNVFTLVNDEPTFGSQFTHGLEADLELHVTPEWKFLANGTLQQAVLTDNPSAPTAVGKVPIGVPAKIFNLWTTYDFEVSGIRGFTVSAGLNYKGKIFGDQLNTDMVPAYTIFDANLTYTQPKWDVAIGIKNIANTLYFIAANGAGAFVGDPRTVYVKADVRF